ncbi:hypothetical protein EWM64_g867 [Hericium alpestre]|uniref:NmrA-like domain-containing protein n=1 Tax=Hericium alpestre TaxID=135208 RepID=A0A4Z0AA68_9AGAM|nr:hypothetical protein EWM64_g867 [Hericium alpestre]
MQNLSIPSTLESHVLPIAFSSTILQGFLDLHDLAAVAASILLSPADHIRARYELVGVNCTYADVAQALTIYSLEHGGEPVECVRVPKEVALKAMEDRGVIRDDFGRRALEVMFDYYDTRGIPGSTNILRWLLGREPTTWEGLIKRELDTASK